MLPDRGKGRAKTWPVSLTDTRYPGASRGLIAVQAADRHGAWIAASDYCAEAWPDGDTVPRAIGLAPMTLGEYERVRELLGWPNHGTRHASAGVETRDPRADQLAERAAVTA